MKKIMNAFESLFALAVLSILAIVVALPAMSAQALLIGRGTDDQGFVHVIYSIDGDLKRIGRGQLESVGVDYFDAAEVSAYLNLNTSVHMQGGCSSDNADDCGPLGDGPEDSKY
jgi:hypothetical protein